MDSSTLIIKVSTKYLKKNVLGKNDEYTEYNGKNGSHCLKRRLYQNCKADNLPVAAGCLVDVTRGSRLSL